MKKLLFFCGWVCAFTLQAQTKITWGESYKQGALSFLSKIVGYDQNGFYAVEDKGVFSNKMMLMKFDKTLNNIAEVDINDRTKSNLNYDDVLAFPNQMYVLYTSNEKRKGDKYTLYASPLDSKRLAVSPKQTELYSVEIIKGSIYGYAGYNELISKDSSKMALLVDMPSTNKKDPNKFVFKVFADDLTPLWTKEHTFPCQDRFFYLEEAVVSNEGNIYCVGRLNTEVWSDKRKGKPTYSYHIYCVTSNDDALIDIPVEVKNQFITDIKVAIAPNGDILCGGFYSKLNSFDVEGVFSITIDGTTHQVKQQSLKAIPISTVVENLSEAKQERLEKKEAKGKM